MHAAISSPDPQASGDGTSMPVSGLLQLDMYIVICRPKCYVNSSNRPKEATVRSIEQFANSAVSPLPREPSAAYDYNLGCNYSPRHGDVASWRAFIATKWSNKHLWIVFKDDRISVCTAELEEATCINHDHESASLSACETAAPRASLCCHSQ